MVFQVLFILRQYGDKRVAEFFNLLSLVFLVKLEMFNHSGNQALQTIEVTGVLPSPRSHLVE
jgi:hypothetical protein